MLCGWAFGGQSGRLVLAVNPGRFRAGRQAERFLKKRSRAETRRAQRKKCPNQNRVRYSTNTDPSVTGGLVRQPGEQVPTGNRLGHAVVHQPRSAHLSLRPGADGCHRRLPATFGFDAAQPASPAHMKPPGSPFTAVFQSSSRLDLPLRSQLFLRRLADAVELQCAGGLDRIGRGRPGHV